MGKRAFISAVVQRIRANPSPDPKSGPHIYSIRVIEPAAFHILQAAETNLGIHGSPVVAGSLYSDDLYSFSEQKVRGVLKEMFHSGMKAVEVKVSEAPGAPWEIIRVNLPQ